MIDLHCHSTASDGTSSPAEVIRLAHEKKLGAVALTDHDTIDGLTAARSEADRLGIRFIPGCELSIDFPHPNKGTLHLLAYNIPIERSPFSECLDSIRQKRKTRAAAIAEKMTIHGFPLTLDDVLQESGNAAIGKPHIAAASVRKGYADKESAYTKFLSSSSPTYVPKSFKPSLHLIINSV